VVWSSRGYPALACGAEHKRGTAGRQTLSPWGPQETNPAIPWGWRATRETADGALRAL